MPQSNFYWEMSVEAVKRKEKGESTYSIHSTVQQEGRGCGGRGTMKAQIPFSPLNSFIHLFVPTPLFPLPSSLSLSPSLSVPSLLI